MTTMGCPEGFSYSCPVGFIAEVPFPVTTAPAGTGFTMSGRLLSPGMLDLLVYLAAPDDTTAIYKGQRSLSSSDFR
jgi:hypothetical protein